MKRYYVYELIDPFNLKPFYVGKGTVYKSFFRRMFKHVHKTEKGLFTNLELFKVIRNILNRNAKVIYNVVFESFDEIVTLAKEKELIKYYGKRQDGGILTNITDGGEGRSHKCSEETKEKIRKKMLGRKFSASASENLSISLRNSEIFQKVMKSAEYKASLSAALTGRIFSEQHRRRISDSIKRQVHEQRQCPRCRRIFKTAMSFGKHVKTRCNDHVLKMMNEVIQLRRSGKTIREIKEMGYKSSFIRFAIRADVGELADPQARGACESNLVLVQVQPSAPFVNAAQTLEE